MKTKKIILGLGIALLGNFAARSQGLDGIIVEKFYKANAADVAGSIGVLTQGAVTYRIYVDMAPTYSLQAIYGNQTGGGTPLHTLMFNTTTTFFNNQDFGSDNAKGIAVARMKNNSNALDTWFSVGASASNQMGVLKSEDTDGAGTFFPHNPVGMLTNTTTATGIALTAEDGSIAGTPQAVTYVGLNGGDSVATSIYAHTFLTTNGSIASLNGSGGPLADNKVLIGQFTTDGVFTFQLNIQIGNGTVTENYVANTPTGSEQMKSGLTASLGNPPAISITTTPATGNNFFTGNAVTIAATATDLLDSISGSIVSVDFYDNGVLKGTDLTFPYSYTFTPTGAGAHSITAKATDNDGNVTTSAASSLTGVTALAPTAVLTAPAANAVIVGGTTTGTVTTTATVTITATATDPNGGGVIDSVAFFVNTVRVGSINGTGPYSFNWVTTGVYGAKSLTAISYDHEGGNTTSAAVAITMTNPGAKDYYIQTIDTTCVATGVCLPINARKAISNVTGFDMVLHYDKSKVTPSGTISAGTLVNPSYVTAASTIDAVNGKMIITVSLNNAAHDTSFFKGIGEVICVGFNKTANFGSIDNASFTIDSIQESRITGLTTVLVDPGKLITHKDSTLKASLQFWADGSAIHDSLPGVATKIYTNDATTHTHKSFGFVSPNTNGQFSEVLTNALIGVGVTLNIDRDIAGAKSVQPVVNGFDALLTRKVVVSDLTFIPSAAQMIAMDVNMDGKISAGDVSQLNQRSVLSIAEFKQAWNYSDAGVKNPLKGNSKDWIFIDGTTLNTNGAYLISSIYPATDGVGFNKDKSPVMDSCIATAISNAASCPLIGSEVYTGILLGDVNGNFKSINADGVIKSASDDKIVFDLSKAITADGFVTIPVSIVSNSIINALDFSMQLGGGVTYNSIVNNSTSLTAMDNLNADDATLRFTSYSLDNLDITQPIVSVKVAATGAVGVSDLSSVTGYLNGDQVNVEVIGGAAPSVSSNGNMVNVYPNPASQSINIVVVENATAQLIDMEGNVVAVVNVYANQKAVIATDNLANGVYTLKVSNADFVSITKVVIAK